MKAVYRWQYVAILTERITVHARYVDTRKIYSYTMAQLVGFHSLTTQAKVQYQASPCGICSGQTDIAKGCTPGTLVYSRYHYSTPLHTQPSL
jgi:hypothetical protein